MVPSGKVSACATGTVDEDDAMVRMVGEAVHHRVERMREVVDVETTSTRMLPHVDEAEQGVG